MTTRQIEQSDFHWPHGLYESAPFVYLGAGLWVSFRLDGPVAAVAGAFLILAGLGILYLRWTYRRCAADTVHDEGLARSAPAPAASGAATTDTACVSRRGLVAAASHGDREVVDALIREVLAWLEARYRLQEEILRDAGPLAAGDRQREHQALAAKISTLHRGFLSGTVSRQALIECIVYETLAERTAGERSDVQRAFLAGAADDRRL